eukprot:219733-Karenia_brevis.AAC.1
MHAQKLRPQARRSLAKKPLRGGRAQKLTNAYGAGLVAARLLQHHQSHRAQPKPEPAALLAPTLPQPCAVECPSIQKHARPECQWGPGQSKPKNAHLAGDGHPTEVRPWRPARLQHP